MTNSCNLSTIDGLLCKDFGSRPISFFFHPLFFFFKQEAGCGGCRGSKDLKLSKSAAFMMHVAGGRDWSEHMLRSLLAF